MRKWYRASTHQHLLFFSLAWLLFVYILSIQVPSTWERCKAWKAASQQLEKAEKASEILLQQEKQLSSLKEQMQAYHGNRITPSDHLQMLHYLEQSCREAQVRILNLPTEDILLREPYTIADLVFRLEGSLFDLLKLCHRWEQKDRVGSIVSLSLNTHQQKKGRPKPKGLRAQLRLRRLLTTNHP